MKSRFTERKAAFGYRSPYERESCSNCAHRSQSALLFRGGKSYDCMLGNFLVHAGGICKHYRAEGATAVERAIEGHCTV